MKLPMLGPLIFLHFLEGFQAHAEAQFYPKATNKLLSPDPEGRSTHPRPYFHWPWKLFSAGRAQSKVVSGAGPMDQKERQPCSLGEAAFGYSLSLLGGGEGFCFCICPLPLPQTPRPASQLLSPKGQLSNQVFSPDHASKQ